MYIIKDKNSDNFFVNPSFWSWDFTKKIDEATAFNTQEEAKEMAEIVNHASAMTYWDYEDIIPHAVVVQFGVSKDDSI